MSALRILLAGVLLGIAASAAALEADEILPDPAMEQRARALSKQLRCMVCQNQSIFDSNAGLARDLRAVVRKRLAAGDSDEQVIAWVRARYGDYVLLEPPVAGHTALLWASPLVFVAIALFAAWRYLTHRRSHRNTISDADAARDGQQALRGSTR